MMLQTAQSDSPGHGSTARPDPLGWRQEGMDLLRGIAAGSIAGMPLLFTMEMWWHGMLARPGHLLMLLGLTLVINAAISLFSGFRAEVSLFEAVSESITATGMGLVLSALILGLIGEIDFDSGLGESMGKIVIEAAPVSLGICFTNTHIRGKSRTGDEESGEEENSEEDSGGEESGEEASDGAGKPAVQPGDKADLSDADAGGEAAITHRRQPPLSPYDRQLHQDLLDIAASASGALLFSYGVAPTEEVLVIATRLHPWQHLLILAASLLLCHTIIFAAGFKERKVHVPSLFQHEWAETLMAYAVSLLVSGTLLYLVGVPEATASLPVWIICTLTLGLVATVGASAGRLVV